MNNLTNVPFFDPSKVPSLTNLPIDIFVHHLFKFLNVLDLFNLVQFILQIPYIYLKQFS